MAKPVNHNFYIVIHEEEYRGKFLSLDAAENFIDKEEWEGALILEICKMWTSGYPPEPEIEFWETTYSDL